MLHSPPCLPGRWSSPLGRGLAGRDAGICRVGHNHVGLDLQRSCYELSIYAQLWTQGSITGEFVACFQADKDENSSRERLRACSPAAAHV